MNHIQLEAPKTIPNGFKDHRPAYYQCNDTLNHLLSTLLVSASVHYRALNIAFPKESLTLVCMCLGLYSVSKLSPLNTV